MVGQVNIQYAGNSYGKSVSNEVGPPTKKRKAEAVAEDIFNTSRIPPKRRLQSLSRKRPLPQDSEMEHAAQKVIGKRRKTSEEVNLKLKAAIRQGNIDDCISALRSGADPDTQTEKGNTALHLAVIKESARFAQLCIERQASVSIKNGDGNSPLFLTGDHHLPDEVMIEMIRLQPDINACNSKGESILHFVIRTGYNTEVILACIEKGADVNCLTREGHSPLGLFHDRLHQDQWTACFTRKPVTLLDVNRVFRALRERGAEFDHMHVYQWNFLHLACIWGFVDLAFSALEFGDRIDSLSEDDETPLEILFKYAEKNTDKKELQKKLLSYVITSKLKNKYSAPEQHPQVRKYVNDLEDPFLAAALFALTGKDTTGNPLLSENEKLGLLLTLFHRNDINKFILYVMINLQLAKEIFPLLIKGGFSLKDPFSESEIKLIFNGFKKEYKFSPSLAKACKRLLEEEKILPFLSTYLWLLPFIDNQVFNGDEKELRKRHELAINPDTSLITRTLFLQDLPEWAYASNVYERIMPALPFCYFPEISMSLVEKPEKFKLFIDSIRKVKFVTEDKEMINEILLDLYEEVLGELPSCLTVETPVATLTELLPVASAYLLGQREPSHLPFEVYALMCLPAERGIEFVESLKDSSHYIDILSYVLEHPDSLSIIPAEVIQKLLNSLDIEQQKKVFTIDQFFLLIGLPQHLSPSDVLDHPGARQLLIRITPLLSGKDPRKVCEKLIRSYAALRNSGESWMEDPEGYMLFVLTLLMANFEPGDKVEFIPEVKLEITPEIKYKVLESLSDEHFLAFFSQLFHHPELAESFNRSMCKLFTLETKDRGRAKNSWEEFTQKILLRLNRISHAKPSTFKENYTKRIAVAKRRTPELRNSDCFQKLEKEGWSPLRWQGRTLLFKRESDGRFLAVKWQKDGEDVSELQKELETVTLLREYQDELQLKSEFPLPIGVFEFQGNLSQDYYSSPTVNVEAQKEGGKKIAYVYEFPDESYFIYANDPNLSREQYERLRKISYHDLGKLGAEDILMIALADLFHNNEPGHETREDAGRYIPLVGLIRSYFFGEGAGRLSRFWKAIEFPNLGESGIRDVGDSDTLDHLDKRTHPVTRKNFVDLYSQKRRVTTHPKASTVLKANFFAEYLQVDELTVGARAKQDNHLSWSSAAKVKKTEELLKTGSVSLFSSYTGIDESVVSPFISHNGVYWDRYGKQMGLWMQNNNRGYLPFLKKHTLPKGIYEEDVKISFSEKLRGVSEELGFAIDGKNPDIGTVNGPYPITEGVKNRFVTIAYMLLMREVMALARQLSEEAMNGPAGPRKQSLQLRAMHLNPGIKV